MSTRDAAAGGLIGGRRAWLVWGVALGVYGLGVFHRSSLGVAGLLAADRFEITNSQLAAFTVLQLFVYAGMQVPVGVLLDRFGARTLLLSGVLLMTAGQFAFAFSDSFPAAVLARGVLGAGDAMVFTSVLRLVAAWFLVRQVPMVVQMTGLFGQLGAVAASAPLTVALRELGWTTTFAGASSVGLVLLVGVLVLVRDTPTRTHATGEVQMWALVRSLRSVWRRPGTQLGLWTHFTAQFSANTFALLWGFPFMVEGLGLSETLASWLLMAMIAWVIVVGLAIAKVIEKHPYQRSLIVLGIIAAMAVSWAAVLLWPGVAPLWLVIVMVMATGTGGPASMVGFDLARTFTPTATSGRANGVVNAGGFVATLCVMGLIGWLLDLRDGRTLADFKVAMSVQFAFWAFGATQLLRYRRKAISSLRKHDPATLELIRAGHQVEGVELL